MFLYLFLEKGVFRSNTGISEKMGMGAKPICFVLFAFYNRLNSCPFDIQIYSNEFMSIFSMSMIYIYVT